MNTGFHLLRRQVQVVFTPLDAQEAKAIAMADNHAFEQVKTLRQGIALTTGKHQLPVALHGAQAAA
nr:Uncharacterised protein [Raoultella sp. NCTC 9187]